MQKYWKEFGGKLFTFEIIEEIEIKTDMSIIEFKEKLKKLEEKHISEIDKVMLY